MGLFAYALIAAGIFVTDLLIKNHIERQDTKPAADTKAPEPEPEGAAAREAADAAAPEPAATGGPKPLLGGLLLLRRSHNTGAFLNLGARRRGLMTVLSLAVTLGATALFVTTFTCRGNALLKTGLSLLLGGAYSNTYDRLMRRYVVDYFSFPVKNKKIRNIVFNISDFCIMIGALLVVLGSIERK